VTLSNFNYSLSFLCLNFVMNVVNFVAYSFYHAFLARMQFDFLLLSVRYVESDEDKSILASICVDFLNKC